MTTVTDPFGTPEPVYNRSGTTIQAIAANGDNQTDATAITSAAGWTVVLVSYTAEDYAVKLPSDAEVGDLVEVHLARNVLVGPPPVLVFAPSGEKMSDVSNDSQGVGYPAGSLFRKVSSDNWRAITVA